MEVDAAVRYSGCRWGIALRVPRVPRSREQMCMTCPNDRFPTLSVADLEEGLPYKPANLGSIVLPTSTRSPLEYSSAQGVVGGPDGQMGEGWRVGRLGVGGL